MPGVYDRIRELYNLLAEDGNVAKAKEIMQSLVRDGYDKKFINTCVRTIGIEKMTESLHDQVKQEMANKKGPKA